MISVGVDAHKRVHQGVALDDAGREVSQWRGANTPEGWQHFLQWVAGLGETRMVGIEGAWGYGRGLAQFLVLHGETVLEVNSRWTAMGRRVARKRDKTDRLDASAVAAYVRREGSNLPTVSAEDETAALDMLSNERDAAVGEATRVRNRLHALLLTIDPAYGTSYGRLKSRAVLVRLETMSPATESLLDVERSGMVHRLVQRLRRLEDEADELAERIRELAAPRFLPLTRLCGINLLTAGMLAGILGPGQRFATDAQLAAYAGVSPLEASSASRVRHRLNRGGNRRLNALFYRIALTQAHYSTEARAYLARRVSEGKTKREAIRALKRHLVRVVWKLWKECGDTSGAGGLLVQANA